MAKRPFRAGVFIAALASLLSLTAAGFPQPRAEARAAQTAKSRAPNILLIITDDQRDTPPWGMPATRRYFKKGGVDFTRAFVTTPLCCPSRSSIMTGRYVHNHRVTSNGLGARLDPSETIQRYLDRAGYRTALIGKYLNAWGSSKPPPFWDRFAYFLPWGNKYYDAIFNIDGRIREVSKHSNRFIADVSVRLLEQFERRDKEPWFLYVAPKAPHMPFHPAPGDTRAEVRGFEGNPAVAESDLIDKPAWIRDCFENCGSLAAGRWNAVHQQRSLLSVDDIVRDVFTKMDRLHERNTIAFFISDNGYMWGEHGLIGKGRPYDQSVRVPFYARWPGHFPQGNSDDRLVANIDIAPTIMKAAGIMPSEPMDGRDLLADTERDYLLLESFEGNKAGRSWASIRTEVEQYIESYYDKSQEHLAFREYYDIVGDHWQLDNLLYSRNTEAMDRSEELAAILATAQSCSGEACP